MSVATDKLQNVYDNAALAYDSHKCYSGLYPLLIRGTITTKPLTEVTVLDIGAGTGTIDEMLLEAGVKRVTLEEPSKSMLNVAEKKLKDYIECGRVTTKLDGLPNVDFDDSSFDVAMMNCVVHFADNHELVMDVEERRPPAEACSIYPGILKSFKETYRVLKPGGMLIITTALPHQLRYSRWYAEFFPWRVANSYPRQPNKAEIQLLLKTAKFDDITTIVDTNDSFIDDSVAHEQFDIEREEWRVVDSDFLSLTDAELADCFRRVREARESGELDRVMKKAKQYADRMGQFTIIIGRKRNESCRNNHSFVA